MAGTYEGNLTRDPELQFGNDGKARATFTIAETSSRKNQQGQWEDEGTMFIRCTVFGNMAENVTNSLSKGNRVIVEGRLKNREWEDKEGQKRGSLELIADKVGPSLRGQVAQVSKATPGQSPQQSFPQAGQNFQQQAQSMNAPF